MSSRGLLAYEEFVRVNEENNCSVPQWESLGHVMRMAWEAAAQTAAQDVLPEEARQNIERRRVDPRKTHKRKL